MERPRTLGFAACAVGGLSLVLLGAGRAPGAKGFGAYGLLFGIVSILALALAGVAYAAGMDPGAACGGG